MKHLIAIILPFFAVAFCYSQENIAKDTTQRIARIEHKFEGNQVKFTPNAPELNQIAGSVKSFSYLLKSMKGLDFQRWPCEETREG